MGRDLPCPCSTPTKPAEPPFAQKAFAAELADIEPAKWVPEIGQVVLVGNREGQIRGFMSDGKVAFVEYETGAFTTWSVAGLRPLPARKVRKQVTVREYRHYSSTSVVFWCDQPYGEGWVPTGRTHSYEVDE